MKINNKKIIVTGAGAGIGRQLTLQLLSKGAHVLALDISKKTLEETEKLADSKKISTYIVDVSDDASINKFIKEITDIKIDGIINNAGIIQPFIDVNKLDYNIINRVMDINFYGPLKLTKLLLPSLLKRKEAHIVNVSSMGGFFPVPGQTIYGASKAALKLFTEGLYAELLDTNIGVTIVFPGAIKTDITKNSGVQTNEDSEINMKMTSPEKAAEQIINAIEKNKFKLYVGMDAKIMNIMYKLNSKFAIKFISNKMKNM